MRKGNFLKQLENELSRESALSSDDVQEIVALVRCENLMIAPQRLKSDSKYVVGELAWQDEGPTLVELSSFQRSQLPPAAHATIDAAIAEPRNMALVRAAGLQRQLDEYLATQVPPVYAVRRSKT